MFYHFHNYLLYLKINSQHLTCFSSKISVKNNVKNTQLQDANAYPQSMRKGFYYLVWYLGVICRVPGGNNRPGPQREATHPRPGPGTPTRGTGKYTIILCLLYLCQDNILITKLMWSLRLACEWITESTAQKRRDRNSQILLKLLSTSWYKTEPGKIAPQTRCLRC